MSAQPVQIIGQGLAGSCLAWHFFWRDSPFQIIDHGTGGSTRIAAGMINPITGKNFEPSWRIEDFHPPAIGFYRKVETALNQKLWHPLPVLRLAATDAEWSKVEKKLSDQRTQPWLGTQRPATPEGFSGAVELQGGGWLDMPAFLEGTARFFSDHFLKTSHFSATKILCEGAAGLLLDQLGTHRCAKGEILTVAADWPETHIRIGAGGWIVPIGNRRFRVGSTYEWNQLDSTPTEKGRERIEKIAAKLGGEQFKVTRHVAAIRPILRRSEPLIGKNSGGDWAFNGLGSKGTLYAPEMARMLSKWVLDGTTPEPVFILPAP